MQITIDHVTRERWKDALKEVSRLRFHRNRWNPAATAIKALCLALDGLEYVMTGDVKSIGALDEEVTREAVTRAFSKADVQARRAIEEIARAAPCAVIVEAERVWMVTLCEE